MNLGTWEPNTIGGPGTYLDKACTHPDDRPARTVMWHTRNGATVGYPYGQPGDRLWVRETWQVVKADANPPRVWYRADPGVEDCVAKSLVGWQGWRPAIHMPRAACRLVLEVTDVRVEKLQEISDEDAEAEGVELQGGAALWPHINRGDKMKSAYRDLWDSINAKRAPWASNPWVWVISFRRIP